MHCKHLTLQGSFTGKMTYGQVDQNLGIADHRLPASSTGRYCNNGRITRSIGTNSVLIHIYLKWIGLAQKKTNNFLGVLSLSKQQQPLTMTIYYVWPTWRGES